MGGVNASVDFFWGIRVVLKESYETNLKGKDISKNQDIDIHIVLKAIAFTGKIS